MNISTRKFSSWRCRTVLTLLAALVTCLSLFCLPASLVPAHAAPFRVDLVPHLVREVGEGGVLTNYGVQGAAFTWHVVVENAGPAVARDATFDLALPSGTTDVHATCILKTLNADCPRDEQLKVSPATRTEDGHLTGTIPYLLGTQFGMSRNSVTIQVTGRYPFRDQVTPTLSVTPSAEAIDTNPYDNETAEVIHLQPVTVPVSVKIEQDTPDLHSGAERHYTVTYANAGGTDAPVTLTAKYASASPSESDTLSTSVTCAASSTAPCPLSAEDEHPAASLLNTVATLPAHTALVFDVRITHTIPAQKVGLNTAPLPQPVNLTASMASNGTVQLTGKLSDQSTGTLTPDAFSLLEPSKEEKLPEIESGALPTTSLLTVPQYSTITADLVREHVHSPEGASTAITGAYPDTSTPGDKPGVSVLVTLRQGIPVSVTVPVRVIPVTHVPSEHVTSEREEFPLDRVPVPAAEPEPEKAPVAMKTTKLKKTTKRLARTGASTAVLILISSILLISGVALRVRARIRIRMRIQRHPH